MNAIAVGMQGGIAKRKLQQALALMVGLMMLVSTGAQAQVQDLGESISVIVSKINPWDTTPERAIERVGGEVGESLTIVDGFEATVPEEAIPALAANPNVRGIVRNNKVTVQGQMGEGSGVASAVYTDVTRASKAWTQGVTGKGVGVALIDTGVDTTGDLAGRVIHAVDLSGENAPNSDTFGHGTFVAGLIAGTGANSAGGVKGVAPDAHLVSVKIAGRDGSTNLFRLLAGLEYVVTHKDALGIRVLNLSLGSDSTQHWSVDPLNFAVQRVWNSGIVVVTAAGNNGKIVKPADDPLVVTVGASDDKTTLGRTDDAVASFSGVGPTAAGVAKPDFVSSGKSVISSRAPGSTIEASFPNAHIGNHYFKGSGTSFSAAIAAGSAALVIQKTWSLSPNQVKQRLITSSKSFANVSANAQGAGSIDTYNAVVSTDMTSANQNIPPALGGGSMQGSSGSSCYRDGNGLCISDAELNAAIGFNRDAYFGNAWAGSQWTGSQWTGSQWTGSQWTGSQWTGSQWTGSQWTGSQWTGSQWTGLDWAGSQWTGSQWTGSQWTSSGWAGSQWTGSQWTGSQWTGSQWTGSQWSGSQWSGSQWSNLEWLGSHWN